MMNKFRDLSADGAQRVNELFIITDDDDDSIGLGQRTFAWIEPSSLFPAQLGSLRGSNLICPVSVAFTTGC